MLGVHNTSVEGISKTFADWHGVLTASDCHFRGINVYEVNPCDPWDRVHVYGTP